MNNKNCYLEFNVSLDNCFSAYWGRSDISLLDHLDHCGGAIITKQPDLLSQLKRPNKPGDSLLHPLEMTINSLWDLKAEPAFEQRNACLSLLFIAVKRKTFTCLPIMFPTVQSWRLCKVFINSYLCSKQKGNKRILSIQQTVQARLANEAVRIWPNCHRHVLTFLHDFSWTFFPSLMACF